MKISEIKQLFSTLNSPDEIPLEILNDERVGVQKEIRRFRNVYEKKVALQQRHEKMLMFEQLKRSEGYRYIAGIDEVGRGPLAGPVVAACVVMKEDSHILEVNDSKQLSLEKRDTLYDLILSQALDYGIGVASCETIDDINIYEATKVAMQQAVDQMTVKPDYLLIDAMKLNNGIPQENLIKGDAKSYSIACASIVAKVTRDRMMADYDKQYPGYAFAENAGYGTKKHLEGLSKLGITPIHRKTFEPIKSMLQNKNGDV
ncbi:ribonuclease HII [Carnobacteriaceae bacterium zg-ZUI252]|nr:ribonuclease HII [Carnobacteriaceae bacterium zg-ZUI252]MBS4770054.1 ribonuclease HII [Carnobacteriaceae bacterium zg-ZUI240]